MKLKDEEMMEDVLSAEKAMTSLYNLFTNECATPKVRDGFLNLLNEEHQMQADVFDEMHQRGWYPTPAAEMCKIDALRQKMQAKQ
jgi:spore coat protein CotF